MMESGNAFLYHRTDIARVQGAAESAGTLNEADEARRTMRLFPMNALESPGTAG